jgi:hypothetical protein
MSRRNSIQLRATKVTAEVLQAAGTVHGGRAIEISVTIHDPSDKDLLKLIADASRLLEWRQRHEPNDMPQ